MDASARSAAFMFGTALTSAAPSSLVASSLALSEGFSGAGAGVAALLGPLDSSSPRTNSGSKLAGSGPLSTDILALLSRFEGESVLEEERLAAEVDLEGEAACCAAL